MRKIYIETSVVSYLTSDISDNIRIAGRQISTKEMWMNLPLYEVFISDSVIAEASKGNQSQANLRLEAIRDFHLLEVDRSTKELAKLLLYEEAIPQKYPEDAIHIAVSAVNKIEFIITWNFKHINNPFLKNKIRSSIENAGYKCPEICSPEEFLLGESNG